MKQPLQIRFLGLQPSEAVEAAAREKAARLDRFFPEIMACRVSIEPTSRHQQQGRRYAVRVDVTLPGHELVVDRIQNEDVHVALRDAFDDIKRRIDDYEQRARERRTAPPPGEAGEAGAP